MTATRAWKLGLLVVGLVVLWHQDPFEHPERSPGRVFLWLSFLAASAGGVLAVMPVSAWLPARRGVLAVAAAFFFGLSLSTADIAPPSDAPEGWFPGKGARVALHARARVVRQIRPGLVLASVVWTHTEHYGFRHGRRRFAATTLPTGMETAFPVALQSSIDETPATGCELTLRLTAKYFPQRLDGSGYLRSLRRSGASSQVRLRPWVVRDQHCDPDWRSRIVERITRSARSGGYPRGYDSLFPSLGAAPQSDEDDSSGRAGEELAQRPGVPYTGAERPADDGLRHLGPVARGIALGMVLGQAGYMDRATKNTAKVLGILHVFAASGLHLALLYGFFFFPLSRLLGPRHPVAAFAPLLPAAFYLWLLDYPVSLARAFFFLMLFASRTVVHRRVTLADHLLNTALLTLLIFPSSMLSLSALLSFAAVAGILYALSPLQRLFEAPRIGEAKPVGWLYRSILAIVPFFRLQALVGMSASLLVTPVLVVFFQSYSFLSPVANLILVPLSNLLLPAIYIALALQVVVPGSLPDRLAWFTVIRGFDVMEAIMSGLNFPWFMVQLKDSFFVPLLLSVLPVLAIGVVLWLRHREMVGPARSRWLVVLVFVLTGPGGYGLLMLLRWLVRYAG